MSNTEAPPSTPAFLVGGGEMGARIRAFDWASHSFGPPESWPQSLKTVVGLCLNAAFPTAVYWGPELRLIYNDAWAPIPGPRHPEALGRPGAEVWPDIWSVVGPQFEAVMATGQGFDAREQMLPMARFGQVEETYWDYNFTPIRDDDGQVAGVLNSGLDVTATTLARQALARSEEQHRTTAEALRESIEDFRSAAELNPQVTWTAQADGQLDRVSSRWREWTGTSGLGETWAEGLHPDDRVRTFEVWGRSVATGEPYDIEHRVEHLKGGHRWARSRAYPRRNEAGAILRWYGTTEDVHEEKLEAEARARVQERLRLATRATSDAIWDWDLLHDHVEWNEALADAYGHLRPEPTGGWWLDHIHPEDRGRISHSIHAVIDGEAELWRGEYRFRRADGSHAEVLDRGFVVRDGTGRAVRMIGAMLDLTERKAAEAALRGSEQRFRTLVDTVPSFVWFADTAGLLNYFNARWHAYTGLSPDDSAGAGWVCTLHPDDVARTAALWEEARARGQSYVVECRYRRKDGAYRWFVARAEPLRDEAGRITGWFGTSTDIDDQKRAEAALKESEARFRAITDSVEQMIWSTRPDGFHDYFNRRWYEYTGVPDGSTDGEGWNDVFHPDDQARAWERWSRSLRTGEPYRIEYRLRHRSGVYRWVLGQAQAVRDEAGRVTRWFGTCTDIQEIVEAREVLARSREELEQRAEQLAAERDRMWAVSRELMLVAGLDGRIDAVNPAWEEVLGWGKFDLAGASFLDLVHPDDVAATLAEVASLGEGRPTPRFENRYRAKDGAYRWLSWTAVPEGGRIFAVARDVTPERAQAEALAKVEDQLRQAQKMEAVGQLTGGVAHDFNNLLQIVVGNLELLGRSLPADAGRQRRSLDNAMSGARRAATLTQRLLAFSRRQPLEPRPVAVNKLVAGMSELLSRSLGETVHLETVLAAGLWRVEVDPNQLENAILNLAVNARDAMPDGGRLTIETANTRLDESYAQQNVEVTPGQYVVICVSDTGVGMSKELAARVFEPFFTTKEVGKGTGLGLSQVYGFVKQSGGHVKIYSEQGDAHSRGTTVKLYLPRFLGEGVEAEEPAEEVAPEGGPEETILVVEDDGDVRTYTVEVLRELGYGVLEAGDAHGALRLLRDASVRCDLLFTDVVLPGGVNGEQLAQAAHEARPGLKVLFTTGYARNAIVHHGRVDPGVALITKPFTYADLAARVRDVLDGGGSAVKPEQ